MTAQQSAEDHKKKTQTLPITRKSQIRSQNIDQSADYPNRKQHAAGVGAESEDSEIESQEEGYSHYRESLHKPMLPDGASGEKGGTPTGCGYK